MTATFFEREPDDIQTVNTGREVQYLFSYYEHGKHAQVGSYQVTVYSPGRYRQTWRAVKFYIVGPIEYKVVAERELTEREFACFEARAHD